MGTQTLKTTKQTKRKGRASHHAETQTRHMENSISYCLDTEVQEEDTERTNHRDLREAIEEKVQELNAEVVALAIMLDHMHLIVSAPSDISPSELVRHLKGYTARRLSKEYPWLRKRGHIWARGYWISTLGDVSIEKALDYVQSQAGRKSFK